MVCPESLTLIFNVGQSGKRIWYGNDFKRSCRIYGKIPVDNPEKVEVKEVAGEQTTVVELRVDKEDLGKVIGKQGRTARSMRTILTAASTKLQKRSVLEIVE